jgi:hypothetical protein
MLQRGALTKSLKHKGSQDHSGAIPKLQKYFRRPLEPTRTNTHFGYIPTRAAT